MLHDHAGTGTPRNIIKTIEKQKARREERLKDLSAEEKKDDGLVFDELGVDHVFIDEAHYFKNLETPTKMERVAGIQTGGSERAFDIFMKARYLGERHPGHGVTFATGTPISNTMVELYTMQRFLDPEGLKSRGIEHFDAWAATFGEVVDTMEISPDGASLKAPQPLRQIHQPARVAADVPGLCRRADRRDARICPCPSWKAASRAWSPARCRMSKPGLQQELVARYDRLRREKVDPREDNALAITTDGRKLALDARLLSATAEDFPGSKLNALAENVASVWRKTAATRGTQMIFCDMGVNPTPWGYCVYDDIIGKLIAGGIPREQIAADRRRRYRRQEAIAVRPRAQRLGAGADRLHGQNGHRHQRAEAAGRPCTISTPRGNRPKSSSGKAAFCGRATATRRWRSIATSPKDRSMRICGRPWKPRPASSAR